MGPEETCVFATYRTNVGGREIVVCCPNCASDMEQAAVQPVEPKPTEQAPARKAPKKKAPRAAKRGGGKTRRPARRKRSAVRKVKRAARKPVRRKRK